MFMRLQNMTESQDASSKSLLSNILRYYEVISKVVSILDSIAHEEGATEGSPPLRVVLQEDTQSIVIYYGENLKQDVTEGEQNTTISEGCEEWMYEDDPIVAECPPDEPLEQAESIDKSFWEVAGVSQGSDVQQLEEKEAIAEEPIDYEVSEIPEYMVEYEYLQSPDAEKTDEESVIVGDHRAPLLTEPIFPPYYIKCRRCPELFECRKTLKQHQQEAHKAAKSSKTPTKLQTKRKCEFCDELLDSRVHTYDKHCIDVHGHPPYVCQVCYNKFPLMSHLGQHFRSEHALDDLDEIVCSKLWRKYDCEGTPMSECRLCLRVFKSTEPLEVHLEHHIKEFSLDCPRCGDKHYESFCNEPKPRYKAVYEKLQCEVCARWTSKKSFKDHMATHDQERKYPCTVCKKTFKVRRTASRHIQSHVNSKNRKRKCHCCTTVLDDESCLPQHFLAEHPDVHPYSCPICNAGFHEKSALAEHCHRHTQDERERVSFKNPVSEYQVGNARVYECTICRRSFATKRATIAHHIIHTDRPYVCSYCNMTFRHQTTLEDHLLDIHKARADLAVAPTIF